MNHSPAEGGLKERPISSQTILFFSQAAARMLHSTSFTPALHRINFSPDQSGPLSQSFFAITRMRFSFSQIRIRTGGISSMSNMMSKWRNGDFSAA
jgi:hypothetical protein